MVFQNIQEIPGRTSHNFRLKMGSPYLNPPQLCNGTCLVIKKITENIIKETILAEKFIGEMVLLTRIPMVFDSEESSPG